MKINELFTLIHDAEGFSASRKRQMSDVVRELIKERKEIGLKNDVIDVYMNLALIEQELEGKFPDIENLLENGIFNIPEVHAFLEENGIISSDDDDNDDYVPEESDEEESDEEDTDDDEDSEEESDDDEQCVHEIEYTITAKYSTPWGMYVVLGLFCVGNTLMNAATLYKLWA